MRLRSSLLALSLAGKRTRRSAPALFEKLPTFWDMKDRAP
jgi:hypothetical protein